VVIESTADSSLPPHIVRALESGSDWLGSWWPTVGFLGVAMVLIGWGWWRGRRTGKANRPRVRRRPTVVAVVLSVVSAAVSGVNAYAGYVPSVGAALVLLDAPGAVEVCTMDGSASCGSLFHPGCTSTSATRTCTPHPVIDRTRRAATR
jgi:hypothetical protein